MKTISSKIIVVVATLLFSINASSQWYGFGQELFDQSGSNVDYFFAPMWQDSTVLNEYSDGISPVWIYGIGQVFDPTSDTFLFAGLNQLSETTPYSVDSLSFPYSYIRNFGGDEDTLIIQFFKEENMELLAQPWPDDPNISRVRLAYDSSIIRSPVPFLEITEILDDEDVSEEVVWKTYPIEELIEAGEIVAATLTYKTGNPYNFGDTLAYSYNGAAPLTNQLNEFVVRYYRDEDQIQYANDYNHALIATRSSRYQDDTNGWDGQYWTGNASGGGFYHANIQFFITEMVGVNEVDSPISLVDLFPNPVSDQLTVSAEIANLRDYNLTIVDINGKLVKTIQATSASNFNIDVSELEQGIYHLQFTNSERTYSERFVIAR